MATNTASGNESTGHDDVAQLLNEVSDDNPLKPVVSALAETVEEQSDRIEDLTTFGTTQSPRSIAEPEDVVRGIVNLIESYAEDSTPVDRVIEGSAVILQTDQEQAEHYLEVLRHRGEIYEPATGRVRTT